MGRYGDVEGWCVLVLRHDRGSLVRTGLRREECKELGFEYLFLKSVLCFFRGMAMMGLTSEQSSPVVRYYDT